MSRTATVLTALVATASLALTAAPVVSLDGAPPAQRAEAGCRKAPAWRVAAKPTKFGIGLNTATVSNIGEDLQLEERRFGTRIPVVRTWDTGMPDSNAWDYRAPMLGNRWIVTSLKLSPQQVLRGTYDAQLHHYFATAPRKQPIFYSFHHEPEDEVKRGEFTPREFRRAFKHIVRIAASKCRSNLYPTLILMGWTADKRSDFRWRQFYPGDRWISVLGWDPYNGAEGYAASYRSPKEIFGKVVRRSRNAGKPYGIAETGSVRIAGDSAGTGRAAWLRAVARYHRRHDASWVTYFQSTNKGDFEIRDAPGLAAWRDAMNG